MPGSSLSLSGPNVILNAAVAESLAGFCKVLDGLTGSELDLAIHKLLKDTFTDHERIIFNGNGYTDEWLAEARNVDFRTLSPHRKLFRISSTRRTLSFSRNMKSSQRGFLLPLRDSS